MMRSIRGLLVSSVALPIVCASLVGAAEPNNGATTQFSEHLIRGNYNYAYGVAAADLDGDGDLDLTSADIPRKAPSLLPETKSDSTLYWFENNGHGEFQPHVIWSDEPGWFERHAIADIDGDGRLDIAIVNNRDGNVVWFANNEHPAEGPWKRSVITTKCPRAYDIVLADFDGDGDLDAATSGYTSARFTWYENPGKVASDSEWTPHNIDDQMTEARTIRAADFNGDGKIDLLGTAVGARDVPLDADPKVHGSALVWYENQFGGAGQPWKKHMIDNVSRAPIHGHAVDADGDGDLDVVMAFGMFEPMVPIDYHEIAWYENVGKGGRGQEWQRHKVGHLPCAIEAVAADLDGDGDTDIAATAWAKGDRVVWFENSGDPRDAWTMHVLKDKWPAANCLIVADLDGDGRPDIAATADDGSKFAEGALELRWWRNMGRASQSPQK